MDNIVTSSFVCPYCPEVSYYDIEKLNDHMVEHWKGLDIHSKPQGM